MQVKLMKVYREKNLGFIIASHLSQPPKCAKKK